MHQHPIDFIGVELDASNLALQALPDLVRTDIIKRVEHAQRHHRSGLNMLRPQQTDLPIPTEGLIQLLDDRTLELEKCQIDSFMIDVGRHGRTPDPDGPPIRCTILVISKGESS